MSNKSKCLCGETEYIVKSVKLSTTDIGEIGLLPTFIKNELFYIKICKSCGRTEFFSAKIIENSTLENKEKKLDKY